MKPTEGRVVHYRIGPYDVIGQRRPSSVGEVRPAKVVQAWGGTAEDIDSHPNLMVDVDGGNDGFTAEANGLYGCVWVTSAPFDPEGKKPGHWFWPPRVA